MDWENVTVEEAGILKLFFKLLEEVGYDWAYAIGDSPREWVICIYKQDGVWKEYMKQDGRRIDFNTNEKNIYDLCMKNLKSVGGNDYCKTQYLMSAFEKEAPLLNIRRK